MNVAWWKKLARLKKPQRISKLKKACDGAWSLAVRLRDGKCLGCGASRADKILFAHHWFVEKHRSLRLRWDLRNGATLCYACHKFQVHTYAVYVWMSRFFKTMRDSLPSAEIPAMGYLAGIKGDSLDEEELIGILKDLEAEVKKNL